MRSRSHHLRGDEFLILASRHTNDDLVVHEVGAQSEDAAVRHRFPGVLDQVAKDANEAREIDADVFLVADVPNEQNVLSGEQTEGLRVQLIEQTPDRNLLAS